MCICVKSQRNHDFSAYADKKKFKMVLRQVPSSAKENNFNTVLCVSAYLLISKETHSLKKRCAETEI